MNVAMRLTRMTCAAVAAAGLCGCTLLGPNYTRPEVNIPVRYAEGNAEAALNVPPHWWALYGDPTLELLVSSGLAKNVDVKLAIARMAEAEALMREANATLLPQLDVNAAIGRSQSSTRTGTLAPTATAIRNNFLISANTSFELDFWGRLRRGREAASAQYAASRYGRDVVALTLAAGISQAYFTVRSLDAQIQVSEETLAASIESLDITRKRAEAGFTSDLDVNQAEGNRAQLAAQVKELTRLRAVAIHQLGILAGMPALHLAAGDLWRLPLPPLPPAGLPSTLLERRPDVREAEAALMAANAQIGVARAAQFPTFSLTGALGAQSRELSTLFSAGAGIWSIGVGVVGPILDWGRYAARTEQAEARAQQAAALYEKTAQTAFREVSDALSNVRLAADSEQDLTTRVEQSRNTLRLARMRYDAGYSAYLEVLDAQRTLNDAQLALARNRQAYLAYTVDLMNALGGGWAP
jgi:outer membrane protein, multidrug efflux system